VKDWANSLHHLGKIFQSRERYTQPGDLPMDLIRSSNHVSDTRNLEMGNVNPASNSSM
jgi:hypothetical protein